MGQRPRAERRLVALYLVLACLTLCHAVYLAYGVYFAEVVERHGGLAREAYDAQHNTIALSAEHPLFHGTDHAPNQYRVGVAWLAKAIGDRVGIAKYYVVYTVIDFGCALAAGWLCYAGLVRSAFFAELREERRRLAVVAMLAALAYPLAWVVPWQRPETLPTALYLVGTLAMLDRVRESRWWVAGVAAATVWQCSVRTDVPAVLGAAVVVLGVASGEDARRMFGSRRICLGAAAMVSGTAVAAQVMLQRVVFPHAVYPPDTPVLELMANFEARRLIAFGIAMLPWAMVVGLAVRFRRVMEPVDWVAMVAGCLYLPLWWAVGVVGEVRLFVPFLLGMVVVGAKVVVELPTGGGAVYVPPNA